MIDDISDFYIATQIVDGKTISILQIRSANQSGTYVCHIEIEGGMVYTPNTPVVADDDFILFLLKITVTSHCTTETNSEKISSRNYAKIIRVIWKLL